MGIGRYKNLYPKKIVVATNLLVHNCVRDGSGILFLAVAGNIPYKLLNAPEGASLVLAL